MYLIIKQQFLKKLGLLFLISILTTNAFSVKYGSSKGIVVTLTPNQNKLVTNIIQSAIDSCAKAGGGTVVFVEGTYLSASIHLKSNTTLQFNKGALLQGSENIADYTATAFINGDNVSNISIVGEGIIDGMKCYNPKGESGYRGPHCIRLSSCKYINISGITIKDAANWAFNCRNCSFATIDKVSIRAGHDGIHTRFCNNFTITRCDVRTGDDAFAGNDNQNFIVTDCIVNSSCNGFRVGCFNFIVKRCRIYGPGEYPHFRQNRYNMLTAFVHFSPDDENPKLKSGNWLIQDVTVENVGYFYMYNNINGLWQTGQPVTNIQFERVKATGLLSAFYVVGDTARNFNLSIRNSSFAFREGATFKSPIFEDVKINSSDLFNIENFNKVQLHDVILEKKGAEILANFISGNSLYLDNVNFITGENSIPYSIEKIKKIKKVNLQFNSSKTTDNQ